jgi:hypothetical protein
MGGWQRRKNSRQFRLVIAVNLAWLTYVCILLLYCLQASLKILKDEPVVTATILMSLLHGGGIIVS